jgi:hypothetical protein
VCAIDLDVTLSEVVPDPPTVTRGWLLTVHKHTEAAMQICWALWLLASWISNFLDPLSYVLVLVSSWSPSASHRSKFRRALSRTLFFFCGTTTAERARGDG